MNVLIIEDEIRASEQLEILVKKHFPEFNILETLESVEDSIHWFNNNDAPDLIFMDIQLADGLSFEIFQQTKIVSPVIFTTAYDQYAIKAFKVNSIDYLLKPLVEIDLVAAIEKFKSLHQLSSKNNIDSQVLQNLVNQLTQDKRKERFIVKEGNSMTIVQIEDINFFYSEDGVSFLKTQNNKRYIVDMTLESIEKAIDEKLFFRINRHQIISIGSIEKIQPYFNNRLSIDINKGKDIKFLVSRNRVSHFKNWVNQ